MADPTTKKARTEHRSILERWVIKGTLILETPAHFGNGDADPLTDMPLLLDEIEDRPLLPGTSIAGALRSYLREHEYGYGGVEIKDSAASMLFGSFREADKESKQSPLIINDALGTSAGFELRDGVTIDPETRTAVDKNKFDVQLLAAGSTFDLQFELIVGKEDSQNLRNALFTALHGLAQGEITLGSRKRRGFGQCKVATWKVFKFDLQTKEGLLNWLGFEQNLRKAHPQPDADLAIQLDAKIKEEDIKKNDQRKSARLNAKFAIDGTMLIRSGSGNADSADTVHLHSARPKKNKPNEQKNIQENIPVIPGTSLAGVLRQRALKIARTIAVNHDKKIAQQFVDGMFGPSIVKMGDKHAKASRVSIKETKIENSTQQVVTRVKIDRFTGGAYESALFSEQHEIGKLNVESVTLDLTLRNPSDAELGLLLLLLKDLWTGDLPIGGESSVGRGRLKGITATLEAPVTQKILQRTTWTFTAEGENIKVEETGGVQSSKLEDWVDAFNKEVVKEQVNNGYL